MYIHERDDWTNFRWDTSQVSLLQEVVFRKQGLLYGRLGSLGFDSKLRAMAENLTHDVVYSSEIEGIMLNVDQVRSSIARRLGIEMAMVGWLASCPTCFWHGERRASSASTMSRPR